MIEWVVKTWTKGTNRVVCSFTDRRLRIATTGKWNIFNFSHQLMLIKICVVRQYRQISSDVPNTEV